jgi:threonine synthase
VAEWAAPRLFPSLAPGVASAIARAALDFPIPLVEVRPGCFVLELFHGPTCAFKDVGARFMAGLVSFFGRDRRATSILVATSGDTGGAVASAFHDHPDVSVFTLFPRDGISERQRRQMTTLGGNVHAVAVDGTFDDCQRMAKEALRDRELTRRHGLTSANSINVARLLPQSLYYLHAVSALEADATTGRAGAPPHFVVPSGNLGNLCAGLIAARAGMPVSGFTAAVNANRGFADFLQGADFEPHQAVSTTSNAMDVGAPSNLERIRWLYGGDDDALRQDVEGVSVSDRDVSACIRRVHDDTGYVLDPHTAVAFEAASRHHAAPDAPVVVLATAHPAKFPTVVEAAIGRKVVVPPSLENTRHRAEVMQEIGPSLDALRIFLSSHMS